MVLPFLLWLALPHTRLATALLREKNCYWLTGMLVYAGIMPLKKEAVGV